LTGKPIALTITGKTATRPGVVSNSDAPPNTAGGDTRFDPSARGRADLAAVYAGLMGCEVIPRDLLEAMPDGGTGVDDAQPAILAEALATCGLLSEVRRVASPEPSHWPALAHMTSGQFVLVLEQSGDELVVYDHSCTDNRARVTLAEFTPFFGGCILSAESTLDDIAQSHAPAAASAHWFWGEFRHFRRHVAEIALGSFVANVLAVSVALFSLQVYDRVIPHQSEATLWVLAAGAGMALLLESFLKVARSHLMDGVGRQIEVNVQRVLMNRPLGMRSGTAGRAPSSLFSAMREFGSVREFFTASTIGSLADIPFLFVFLILVASIAGNVVWVLIIGGILMILPGLFLQKRMMRLTQETQGAGAKASRLLHEAVFELDTVKTQRAEDRFRRLWAELTTLSALKSSDQRKLASVLTFWSQALQQGTYVVAIVVCTYLVFAGQFTVGSIIAVSILTSRTLAPLTQIAGIMARWSNVKSALEGLDSVALAPQDSEAGRSYLRRETTAGGFEIHDLRFGYDGAEGAPTLDIAGLAIPAGQTLAVLGANGSGKTTLLKVLSGLYVPDSGRVMLDGTDMGQIDARDLRRLIGHLGQDVRLFSGTLRDNLNLTLLERDDARLMQALDFAGLGPFVRGHPKGLDLDILDGGQGLSQGQRQSIGWARLWLQDPKVCLLDEPTAALDQTLERTLISRLETWLAERTAVIATHRMPIVALADRTMILQQGRMAVDGPRDQVLAHLSRGDA